MAKIVCENCESIFKLENVKDKKTCPVCGEMLFSDDVDSENEEIDKNFKHPDLYYYNIDDKEKYENQDLRDVWCQCTSCREVNTISFNKFSVIKSEYVKLKDDVNICCEGCGKVINNLFIPKRPENWQKLELWKKDYKNMIKCPVCSSTKVHKISLTNKAASTLVFGVLAAGHVSKTYQCDICKSKF